jgi:HEAT repeat protein
VDTQARPDAGSGRQRGRWLLAAPVLACASLAGCAGWWDEVTSREFKFKEVFHRKPPEDPLTVVEKDPDGDHRAKALRALKEPLQHGGSQADQDKFVQVLVSTATTDRQAVCRVAAVETLSTYRDPRAAEGLKEAYYRASSFNPDTAAVLKCQVLEALGKTGQPATVEFLVKVLREPPVEGSEADRQQKTDERIVAARALAHFSDPQATGALVGVLRTDQDVALRNRARDALEQITGKDFPADARAWEDFLNNRPGNSDALAGKGGIFDKFLRLTSGNP